MIFAHFFVKCAVLYCTVSNMQVSLLGVYVGTRNMFTLQRGVRHDQHVLVIWAFVTTSMFLLYGRSLRRGERPQKLWG